MTQKIKKKVMKMVHQIKKIETKLPQLRIIIKLGGYLTGLAVVIALFDGCEVSVFTVLGVYIGYRVLRLLMRLFRLICMAAITCFSIIILVLIITLLIF